jgi:hypothetical protein
VTINELHDELHDIFLVIAQSIANSCNHKVIGTGKNIHWIKDFLKEYLPAWRHTFFQVIKLM